PPTPVRDLRWSSHRPQLVGPTERPRPQPTDQPGRPARSVIRVFQTRFTTVPSSGRRKSDRSLTTRWAAVSASTPETIISWAIAAATFGAANEVPDHLAQPSKRSGSAPHASPAGPSWNTNVLTTPTPGAQASTHRPWLVNAAGP